MQQAELLPADPVRDQYERWVYPPPCYDLSNLDLTTPACAFTALRELYFAYWPTRPFRDNLDVLVAGCGTLAAAACAYFNRRSRIVGIDISSASLAHSRFLRDKYRLDNLELIQCPVEDCASLGRDFDFIACHGVLHHMNDPLTGLRALKTVLRPDGVAGLMLYAKYGRNGVYMLQDLFRILGLQQRPEDLALVKAALHQVNADHPVRRYLEIAAADLSSDAGLVDTFLHKRDCAYSVSECLQLVSDAGLAFAGWDENGLYYPDAHLPCNSPLRIAMEKLPDGQIWEAMELFYGNTPGHFFHVCHADRPEREYRVRFDNEDFLDYVPVRRISQSSPPDPLRGRHATIARPPFPPVSLDQNAMALFSRADGQHTIRQCIAASGLAGPPERKVELARGLFRTLWRMGYAWYRMPAVKA